MSGRLNWPLSTAVPRRTCRNPIGNQPERELTGDAGRNSPPFKRQDIEKTLYSFVFFFPVVLDRNPREGKRREAHKAKNTDAVNPLI
jgi:hypothetical protein